jgi:hypothetical protein
MLKKNFRCCEAAPWLASGLSFWQVLFNRIGRE